MWHMGDGWGWWMMMGWVWMVAFWGLIMFGVYSLMTRSRGDTRPPEHAEPTALEILDRRYARGELSTAEYESMGERLTSGQAIPRA